MRPEVDRLVIHNLAIQFATNDKMVVTQQRQQQQAATFTFHFHHSTLFFNLQPFYFSFFLIFGLEFDALPVARFAVARFQIAAGFRATHLFYISLLHLCRPVLSICFLFRPTRPFLFRSFFKPSTLGRSARLGSNRLERRSVAQSPNRQRARPSNSKRSLCLFPAVRSGWRFVHARQSVRFFVCQNLSRFDGTFRFLSRAEPVRFVCRRLCSQLRKIASLNLLASLSDRVT